MARFVGAIDQGTTSTRYILFDHAGNAVAARRREHRQILPHPGWIEHDPMEIWQNTLTLIESTMRTAAIGLSDVAALGLTNQRETTIVWNRRTGVPYYNAIVWQDARTEHIISGITASGLAPYIAKATGLRPATYFAAAKLKWILDNVPAVRADAQRGLALFGTVDTWLTWNLTGGARGGVHLTDVTNASRTMLMNLATLAWDDEILDYLEIPEAMLPSIRPSSDPNAYGEVSATGALDGTPLAGVLGDQQAALFGQACFAPGDAKCTYGTGNFMLLNTGTIPVRSTNGLLTTLAYQLGQSDPVYALEGAVAMTGAAVQWLRDQIGLVDRVEEIGDLAASVEDNGGVYFVPAFSGLLAPYWNSAGRGTIVGLSRSSTAAHIARATLEAICHQTRAVFEAMEADARIQLGELKVDGGVTASSVCMQLQADILGRAIRRSGVPEATALGAAYSAGLAVRFWSTLDELRENWSQSARWVPRWPAERREKARFKWQKAVSRAVDWL